MNYVVGSGPSGVTCAWALVKRGLDVTMLDIGDELPSEPRRAIEQLRAKTPELWNAEEMRAVRGSIQATTRGIRRKSVYGSEFIYGDDERDTPIERHGVDIEASVGRGGFSNVWGAAILPVVSEDILDWPLTVADLAPHYEAVFEMMPLAGMSDGLSHTWPLYKSDYHPLRPSAQAQSLLQDLIKSGTELYHEGFKFGASRLAVAKGSRWATQGCVYCGLCLSGCPYGLIYNTLTTLDELMKRPQFRYIPGVIVRKVRESGNEVEIDAQIRDHSETRRFNGDRVFLGAGVVGTTKILLDSLDASNQELLMRQSQYFAFPWLRYSPMPGATAERLHTLAQVFIEVSDSSIASSTIHLQVYTYNDLYWNVFGPVARSTALRGLLGNFMSRLLYVQGYLHSDISPTIAARLVRHNGGTRLSLEARQEPRTSDTIRKVLRKIAAARQYFRAVPIRPLLTVGRPGYGSHVGGTFPMRRTPRDFESDLLGRPAGFRRIHIVDSGCLPSVPATTVTLTVMANAHRIGTAA